MRAWLSNLLYVTAAVLLPLALLLLNAVMGLGGVVVTIALIAWMGFAVILLSPLLE